jgi:hypothetical protein
MRSIVAFSLSNSTAHGSLLGVEPSPCSCSASLLTFLSAQILVTGMLACRCLLAARLKHVTTFNILRLVPDSSVRVQCSLQAVNSRVLLTSSSKTYRRYPTAVQQHFGDPPPSDVALNGQQQDGSAGYVRQVRHCQLLRPL